MLLHFLFQLAIILGFAHFLGELMRRWKQPAVVGNILAGLILGPSIFGHWFPSAQLAVFPHDQNQSNLLAATTWLGLLLLLFSTGLETDFNLIVRKGRVAFLISFGGLIVPFASGFYLGHYMPASLLARPDGRLAFSLFLAVAMCISALPIIAIILRDLKILRLEVGQLTLAAAMIDDTIGWILLSVVSGLVLSGRFEFLFALRTLGLALLFLLLSFTLGKPLVRWIVTWTDNVTPGPSAQLAVLICVGLLASAFTHWLGLESVLGIFVVGMLAGMVPRLRGDTVRSLDLVVTSFLAPIYFGLAGLRVNIWSLLNRQTLFIVVIVIAVACLGKLIGVYLGAWTGRVPAWERLAISFGMNARGSMEVVVATVGFSMGILTYQMYSVIVVMAVATALMAGPAMRWALSHITLSASDADRLQLSAATARSFIRGLQRVLVPAWSGTPVSSGIPVSSAAPAGSPAHLQSASARIVALLNQGNTMQATALYVSPNGAAPGPHDSGPHAPGNNAAPGYKIRSVTAANPAQAILAEAENSYDLILLSASHGNLDPTTDTVIRNAACPTLLVKTSAASPAPLAHSSTSTSTSAAANDSASPAFRNILVYADGDKSSAPAIELAAKLAAASSATLTVLCVAEPHTRDAQPRAYEAGHAIAREIATAEAEIARRFGAAAEPLVEEAPRPETGILHAARERNCDLIVLHGSVLPLTGRAFLGSLVENLLRDSTSTVAVLNT
jgi:Kef-type K+ transport system membrane component KefB/nucleotide-binding universal stress UspA family protein